MSRYSLYVETALIFNDEHIKFVLEKFHSQGIMFHEYPLDEFTIETPQLTIEEAKNIFLNGIPNNPDMHLVLTKKNDTFFYFFIINDNNRLGILLNGFSCSWIKYYVYSDTEEIDIPRYLNFLFSAIENIPVTLMSLEHDKYPYEVSYVDPIIFAFVRMEGAKNGVNIDLQHIYSNATKNNTVFFEDSNCLQRLRFTSSDLKEEFVLYINGDGYLSKIVIRHDLIELFPLHNIKFIYHPKTGEMIPDVIFYLKIMLSLCENYLILNLKTENFSKLFKPKDLTKCCH
jgi:hypothetical protein